MQAYFAAKDWVPRVDPHHIYRGHVAVDAIIAEIEPKPYRPKFFEVIRLNDLCSERIVSFRHATNQANCIAFTAIGNHQRFPIAPQERFNSRLPS